jgi:ABC-2 type transport system ATP-binding protein
LPRPPARPAGGACAFITKGTHNEVRSSIRYMGRLYSYSMMTMLFEVHGLSKRFGRIQALADVSFHVRAGEVLGLIGPNGAGKSTLFECLAGVLPSNTGEVFHDGRPVTTRERSSLLFYVPDGIAPWPAQSVRWALDFTIGFLNGRQNLLDEVADQMDLRPLLDQPIGTLSKGQRKRALLAIGLLTPQPALLIDEPFEGLDLRQARDIAVALRAHATRGRTLFLSIHQISDAARFCDRFVLLNSGRVRGEGTVEELAALAHHSTQNLEEVFLALT